MAVASTQERNGKAAEQGGKRQAILNAAEEIFLKDGFPGTSMDRIAAQAGVSKQTVYAHFQSKELLFVAVVENTTARLVSRNLIDPKDDAELAEELIAIAEQQLNAVLTPRNMQLGRLIISEAARFPQFGMTMYETATHRDIITLANALSRWTELGLIAVEDPVADATILKGMFLGDWLQKGFFTGALPTAAEIRARARSAVAMFLAAHRVHA